MILENFDLAQLVLYLFWFFFAGLVLYLRREDKRIGYPLEREGQDYERRGPVVGFPKPPEPKEARVMHPARPDEKRSVEDWAPDRDDLALEPTAGFLGAPYTPTGDAMKDGVGPAAWSNRSDEPELTFDGHPKIVPLARAGDEVVMHSGDPDLVGMAVYGADGVLVGIVEDIWVERSEPQVRFLDTALEDSDERRLVPMDFCRLNRRQRTLNVKALKAQHFTGIPQTASDTQISMTEEDKIRGYFAGGYLYADETRMGPWL